MILKQSTAVVIEFGPFVDKADGFTLKTGLVSAIDNGSTGILISKNGGTLTIRHASVTASTYDAHGCYKVTLDATDTNTLGTLRVIYTDASAILPVWQDFMVVTANQWDTIHGASIFDVNTTKVSGTSQTARDIGASVLLSSGTGTGQLSITSGMVKTQTNSKTNTALAGFMFLMVDTAGIPRTGLSVTAQRAIDGGAFSSCANSVTEIANGVYKIDLATTDLNGAVIALRFTATGAQDLNRTLITTP